MKIKISVLSRKYEAALREHLKPGATSRLSGAASLGRKAVSLGLETLDLARIHERALLIAIRSRTSAGRQNGLIKRAQAFFIEAIIPIERTHLSAASAELHWNELSERLHVRSDELAASKRNVKAGIMQRKAAEEALKKKSKHYAKLLEESRSSQESLRSLAHRVISAQENERGQISRELHDEIAQVLLGINVRMLTLQHKGTRDAKMLLKEITSARQLVEKSVKTMRRVVREFARSHEK